MTRHPRRAREGRAEALRAVRQEELERDFEELRAFRETREEWDRSEWQCPDTGADEKV